MPRRTLDGGRTPAGKRIGDPPAASKVGRTPAAASKVGRAPAAASKMGGTLSQGQGGGARRMTDKIGRTQGTAGKNPGTATPDGRGEDGATDQRGPPAAGLGNPTEDRITPERIQKYLDLTGKALGKVKLVCPANSFAGRIAANFLDMATRYHADARHFHGKGDFVNAFATCNYAHGWLDAGARLGVFDVGGDDQLFTLLD